MASASQSLDTLIVKATNPLVDCPDPVDVALFCEKVTHESDGVQIATRLLAYRIHSPQDKEALHALALLEQCVKSCGPAFQSEVGKFRFLNELIKLVSPRYQAHRTPNNVKQRVLEILYSWTIDLKAEPKILEAYDMLKKQGVVKENPTYIGSCSVPEVPPPREKNPIFENAEKDAMLQKLLRSKNPEDLQAANRLIKNMVREEENRQEAASRRQLDIRTAMGNIDLLTELLDNVEANGATAEEMELCKEMAGTCERLRPNLFRLAAETDDKEDSLLDILRTSDDLSHVLERYEVLARSTRLSKSLAAASSPSLDLLDLGPIVSQSSASSMNALDEQLLSLGLDDLTPSPVPVNLLTPHIMAPNANDTVHRTEIKNAPVEAPVRPTGLEELDVLGETLLKKNLPPNSKAMSSFQKPPDRISLNLLAKQKEVVVESAKEPVSVVKTADAVLVRNPEPPLDFDLLMQNDIIDVASPAVAHPTMSLLHPSNSDSEKLQESSDVLMLDTGTSATERLNGSDDVQLLNSPTEVLPAPSVSSQKTAPPLADIILKFEDIKPSSKSPIPLLVQESGLNIVLHSASAKVPEGVSAFVISTTGHNASPLTNYTFQAVVPKGSKVKLHPSTDNKLPTFNPFLPPPSIIQIMLISTAGLSNIEFKFVVSYDMDDETVTEIGSLKELSLNQHSS